MLAIGLAAGSVAAAWWRKAPIVLGLILGNVLVFVVGAATGIGYLSLAGSPLLDDLAARVSYLSVAGWPKLYTILTATFLHANALHIFGNMVILLLVGLLFEERVGRARFLVIYFWSAITAVLLHAVYVVLAHQNQNIPLVGASGAVFGILAAFATLYPMDRVAIIIPPLFFPIRMPVVVGAGIYMLLEFVAIYAGGQSNVAHAAHFGGAAGGVIMALLLRGGRPSADAMRGKPLMVRYDVLERLATTSVQRGWIEKVRENADHPDTQRAWLERLLPTLQCPEHGSPFAPKGRGRITCPNGHEERYAE